MVIIEIEIQTAEIDLCGPSAPSIATGMIFFIIS